MRVLLNATDSELTFIGGDFSYYRTLSQLGSRAPGWEFSLLKHTSAVLRARVRQIEVLARKAPISSLKGRLFTEARQVPISTQDIHEQRPDVVFSTVLAARLPKRAWVPQVWYSQGISPAEYYDYWDQGISIEEVVALYRRMACRVDMIVVGTHDCAQRMLDLCGPLPCQVTVVPQVTLVSPLDALSNKQRGHGVGLLFVGRDYKRKGLPEVLAAYERLKPSFNDMQLHIVTVGDCPLRTASAHLSDIFWYANVSDAELHSLFERCDVVVVPTYADTYNLVLVEAMAKGCVVISSDLPPLGEVAPHNEVGLLVPRGDVDALTAALERVVQDAQLRHRFAQASLDLYKREYAPEVVVPQLLAAFEQAATLRR